MSGVDDEPVLSEVHMETCPPNTSSWCTRFHYSMPEQALLPAAPNPPPAAPSATNSKPSHSTTSGPTSSINGSTSSDDDLSAGMKQDLDLDLDADGDLVASRPARKSHYLTIQHSLATPVSRCGEQVWLGACLLADFVLSQRQLFAGQVVVELGAGVGLVSLIAGQFAARVLLTDGDLGALQLASRNIAANSMNHRDQQQQQQQQDEPQLEPQRAITSSAAAAAAAAATASTQQRTGISSLSSVVLPRQLDWLQLFDTQLRQLSDGEVLQLLNTSSTTSSGGARNSSGTGSIALTHSSLVNQQQQQQQQQQQGLNQNEPQTGSYSWTAADLSLLVSASIWLAADVVYNETITDAFMRTTHQLMLWQHAKQQQLQQQQQQQQQLLLANTAEQPAASAGSFLAGSDTADFDSIRQQCLPVLYVAVEKRYNFTYRDLDARASAFDHFMTYITPQQPASNQEQQQHLPLEQQQHHLPLQQQQQQQQQQQLFSPQPVDQQRQKQQQQSHCSDARQLRAGACSSSSKPLFRGRRLMIDDVPQALEYDRSGDLELWELVPLLE